MKRVEAIKNMWGVTLDGNKSRKQTRRERSTNNYQLSMQTSGG
jgi:hypothetical protein